MSEDEAVCVEHVWVTTDVVVASDGTHIEKRCERCAAATIVGPDEIAGRV